MRVPGCAGTGDEFMNFNHVDLFRDNIAAV